MIYLLIGLPVLCSVLAVIIVNIKDDGTEFALSFLCLLGVLTWIICSTGTIIQAAHGYSVTSIKSPDPLNPELRITVRDSIQDTLYIYKR